MRELLAEMGLPLAQSKQRFTAMDLTLRQEFRQMIEKLAGKYKVDAIIGTSFTLQYGYRFKYCASDVVYAMLALLESSVSLFVPLCLIRDYFEISIFFLIHSQKTSHRNDVSWMRWTVCRA